MTIKQHVLYPIPKKEMLSRRHGGTKKKKLNRQDATPRQTIEIERAIEHLNRPDRLHLIEVLVRSLQKDEQPPPATERKANLARLLEELGGIPTTNPEDGLSNRDHDAVIYGNRSTRPLRSTDIFDSSEV